MHQIKAWIFVLVLMIGSASIAATAGEWTGGPYPQRTDWELVHEERFETPIPEQAGTWRRVDYEDPKSALGPMDDNGAYFYIKGGELFKQSLRAVQTYRKEISFGEDHWLTLSYSARDEDHDGIPDHPPVFKTEHLDGQPVGLLESDQHGGLLICSTRPLPARYRIEYELVTREFTDTGPGDKTNAPWGGPSAAAGKWNDASSVKGFYDLAIVDYADPAPRNNRWVHDRRKVCIDEYHNPSTLFDTWDPREKKYYPAFENTLNMFFATPSQLYSLFMMETPGGIAYSNEDGRSEVVSVGEIQPEVMPAKRYRFAIERDERGYTVEVRGEFRNAGLQTYRYHRDFIQSDARGKQRPIWHYNQTPEEYDGRFDELWTYKGSYDYHGSKEYTIHSWPTGSAYPDYFIIGDPHTNYYAVKARVANLKLFVPKADVQR
ncbi:MAG TPA: hypothetical protein VKK61_11740 [Tepidisphaeraceae bacterium]|nr:hypothetical protein [Tepidisphaeraceae bacterium]